MNSEIPIDAVISWVDGNDPVHKAVRYKYSHNGEEFKYEDVASDTRFTSVGEIKYCVASILRFAPWIRKIHIVTDNQNPGLEEYIKRYFPDCAIPIEIIDHKVIFAGYEQYLPVFNSLAVESMLWRIPGLSEKFLYFNDDFMLVRPVTPENFFRKEKTIVYGDWQSLRFVNFLHFFKNLFLRRNAAGYRVFLINTARLVGLRNKFLRLYHIPFAQRKSLFEDYYADHQDVLIKNIGCRFRNPHQYNPQALNYLLGFQKGLSLLAPAHKHLVYLKPKPHRGGGYVAEKLQGFEKKSTAPFCCFNSLDQASEKDLNLILSWIHNRLDVGK